MKYYVDIYIKLHAVLMSNLHKESDLIKNIFFVTLFYINNFVYILIIFRAGNIIQCCYKNPEKVLYDFMAYIKIQNNTFTKCINMDFCGIIN